MTQSTLHSPAKTAHASHESAPVPSHKRAVQQSVSGIVSDAKNASYTSQTNITFDQKTIPGALLTINDETIIKIKEAKFVVPLTPEQQRQVKQWQNDQKTLKIDIRSAPPAITLSTVSPKTPDSIKINALEAQAINLTVLQNKTALAQHATPKMPDSVLKPTPVLLQQSPDIQKLHLHVPKVDAVIELRLPKLHPEIANLLKKVAPNTFALIDVTTSQAKITSTYLPVQIAIDGLDMPITTNASSSEKGTSLLLKLLQQQLPSQFQISSKVFTQWVNKSDLAQVLSTDKMHSLTTLLNKTDTIHIAKTPHGMTMQAGHNDKNLGTASVRVIPNKDPSSHIGRNPSMTPMTNTDLPITVQLNKTQLLEIDQTQIPVSTRGVSDVAQGQDNFRLKHLFGTLKEFLGTSALPSPNTNKISLTTSSATLSEPKTENVPSVQAQPTNNKLLLNDLSLFKDLQYAAVETKLPMITKEFNKLLATVKDIGLQSPQSGLQHEPITNRPVSEQSPTFSSDTPESDINQLLRVFANNSLIAGLENQFRAPQQTSSLLNGLTTMVQIALVQKLNGQLDTQRGLSDVLKQQLKPFIPATSIASNGRISADNGDNRNALVNGIAQVLKNHSQARKINAEVNTQTMDTQYFILPNIANHNKDNIEVLFKREKEHANTHNQREQEQGWHVSLRFAIGEYGVLLTKAFIQNKVIQLNLYASTTSLLNLVNTHKESLETRLVDLGFDLKGYQSYQGKIPDSLVEQQHEIWQTQI